ncbi:MAG TPA: hypothetical protein VM165_24140 [Planctomycetaceae bacterium]|nr:hypothetical protein [Planctomycetaceae bacterium]
MQGGTVTADEVDELYRQVVTAYFMAERILERMKDANAEELALPRKGSQSNETLIDFDESPAYHLVTYITARAVEVDDALRKIARLIHAMDAFRVVSQHYQGSVVDAAYGVAAEVRVLFADVFRCINLGGARLSDWEEWAAAFDEMAPRLTEFRRELKHLIDADRRWFINAMNTEHTKARFLVSHGAAAVIAIEHQPTKAIESTASTPVDHWHADPNPDHWFGPFTHETWAAMLGIHVRSITNQLKAEPPKLLAHSSSARGKLTLHINCLSPEVQADARARMANRN